MGQTPLLCAHQIGWCVLVRSILSLPAFSALTENRTAGGNVVGIFKYNETETDSVCPVCVFKDAEHERLRLSPVSFGWVELIICTHRYVYFIECTRSRKKIKSFATDFLRLQSDF